MNDTIIALSSGGAGFAIGAIFAVFAIGILRPASTDAAWQEGYEAGLKEARADRLDVPSILRRRRHHLLSHMPPCPLPENDVAAEAALALWSEELKASGRVVIPKEDLAATFPLPLAPMADLLRWLRVSFPGRGITLTEQTVILSEVRS